METEQLKIIYEDEVLLVCDKPSGLMVEPDRNNHPNLLQLVRNYLKKDKSNNPYVQHLHRLDRPVSGIVLFTKQKKYLRNLSEQFAQRKVKKYYKALTLSRPVVDQGMLQHWHRKEKKKAVLVEEGTPFSEQVSLEYIIQPWANFYCWNIQLHTGKYHQIRAQLSSLQCPILGDHLYGSDFITKANAIALQAIALHIIHPISNDVVEFNVTPSEQDEKFKRIMSMS